MLIYEKLHQFVIKNGFKYSELLRNKTVMTPGPQASVQYMFMHSQLNCVSFSIIVCQLGVLESLNSWS